MGESGQSSELKDLLGVVKSSEAKYTVILGLGSFGQRSSNRKLTGFTTCPLPSITIVRKSRKRLINLLV